MQRIYIFAIINKAIEKFAKGGAAFIMLSFATNVIVFSIFIFLMLFEYIFFNLIEISYTIAWMCTSVIYFVFIVYQVLVKANEDMEKNRIKDLLDEVFDAIYGIPLVNQNNKMIIKWDLVFKKLIDRKEHGVYEKIIKETTKKIDYYVNLHPSLLLNNGVTLKEKNYNNIDLNSLVVGAKSKEKEGNKKNLELNKMNIQDLE